MSSSAARQFLHYAIKWNRRSHITQHEDLVPVTPISASMEVKVSTVNGYRLKAANNSKINNQNASRYSFAWTRPDYLSSTRLLTNVAGRIPG